MGRQPEAQEFFHASVTQLSKKQRTENVSTPIVDRTREERETSMLRTGLLLLDTVHSNRSSPFPTVLAIIHCNTVYTFNYQGRIQDFTRAGVQTIEKGDRRSRIEGCAPSPDIFSYFLYQNGEFLCIPGDIWRFAVTVSINMFLSKKGTLIKRVGVWTPWTPPGSAP